MTFSNRVSKFGKGDNLSAVMPEKDRVDIFYKNKAIMKKEAKVDKEKISLSLKNKTYPYSEVIPVGESFLVVRINQSFGVVRE